LNISFNSLGDAVIEALRNRGIRVI